MGGGSHNPDSEIDDQPSIPKGSVSGAKSSHGHGNMDHDLSDEYSHMGNIGEHRGHGPGRNAY